MKYRIKKMWVYEIARKYHKQISTVMRLLNFDKPDHPDGKYDMTLARVRRLSATPKFVMAKFKPVMAEDRTVLASSRAIVDLTNGNFSIDSVEKMLKRNNIVRTVMFFGKDNNIVYPLSNGLARIIVLWEEEHKPESALSTTEATNFYDLFKGDIAVIEDRINRFITEVRREYDADASERRPRQLELPLEAPEGNTATTATTAEEQLVQPSQSTDTAEPPCKCTCEQQDPILKIIIEVTPGKTTQELVNAFKDFITKMGQS